MLLLVMNQENKQGKILNTYEAFHNFSLPLKKEAMGNNWIICQSFKKLNSV